MSLRDLSKNLSSELENLFANLGDSNLPEHAHRLDDQKENEAGCEAVDISGIMARMKQADGEKG